MAHDPHAHDGIVRVADLMSSPVYALEPSHSLPLLESLMGLRRIRHVPIVDSLEHHKFLGLVTHRDLLSAQISALSPLTSDERSSLQLSVPISKIMRTEVWTIRSDATAEAATDLMLEHKFGCLPVVDDGRLVGILTEADLLRLVKVHVGRRKVGLPRVADAMTPSPVTIDRATTVEEARQLMKLYRIRHLPIVSDGKPVSLVTERDLRLAEVVFAEAQHSPSASRAVGLVGIEDLCIVPPSAPLDVVLAEMFRDRRDAVVVVDPASSAAVAGSGSVVGVLTSLDACRLLSEHLAQPETAT
jgi:CBS domain-containing membrane protein